MEQAVQEELESTLHYFKGGALDVTNTVLDTADIVTGEDEVFIMGHIIEDLEAQGVTINPTLIRDTLQRYVAFGKIIALGSGSYQWVRGNG